MLDIASIILPFITLGLIKIINMWGVVFSVFHLFSLLIFTKTPNVRYYNYSILQMGKLRFTKFKSWVLVKHLQIFSVLGLSHIPQLWNSFSHSSNIKHLSCASFQVLCTQLWMKWTKMSILWNLSSIEEERQETQ